MKYKQIFIIVTLLALLGLVACNESEADLPTAVPDSPATLAATATDEPTAVAELPTATSTSVVDEPTAGPTAAGEPQSYTSSAGAFTLEYSGDAILYENERPSADGVLAPAEDSISILNQTAPGSLVTIAYFTLEDSPALNDFIDSHSECTSITSEGGEDIIIAGETARLYTDALCGLVGSTYLYLIKGSTGYRFTIESNVSYNDIQDQVQPILDSFMSTAVAASGLRQIYHNEAANFSFRLPADWQISEPTDSPLGQMITVGPQTDIAGAGNNIIIVADAAATSVEALASSLLCGSADGCDAPNLQAVTLRNNIPAQLAFIGGDGQPTLPWYFAAHDDYLLAFTMHDPDTLASLEAIVQSLTWGNILETGTEGFPAAQAARTLLAQEVGINPYQIILPAIQAVEWPDGCLGVHQTDVLCAQGITPGYAVTAQVDGRYYQVNTDESGSAAVLVPGIVPPAGGVALTQEGDNMCAGVTFHPELGVTGGPCDGEMTSYPLDSSSEAAQKLSELLTQYAPFHAQTPVGTVNFSGLGEESAVPTAQRLIAELTRFLTDIALSGRTSAGSQLAFGWHREGGIAGFCDDLAVYTYGQAVASSCQNNVGDGPTPQWLSLDQLTSLYDWVDRFSGFEIEEGDPAGVSDAMSISLTFTGLGSEEPTEAEKAAILNFASQLFSPTTAAAFIPHTVSGDPGEVVNAFLSTLLEEQSGQSSITYLNPALQKQVSEGQTIPQMLGLQATFSTFEYSIIDRGTDSGTAVVEATIGKDQVLTVTFSLNKENDLWYISQIEQ